MVELSAPGPGGSSAVRGSSCERLARWGTLSERRAPMEMRGDEGWPRAQGTDAEVRDDAKVGSGGQRCLGSCGGDSKARASQNSDVGSREGKPLSQGFPTILRKRTLTR